KGRRGFKFKTSLAQFLADHRGVKNTSNLPELTVEQILVWADAHQQRTGAWPKADSGPVLDAHGEKWANIDCALAQGLRVLPGGSSLAKLLAEHRGVRNRKDLPRVTVEQILAWSDPHYQQTGRWPTRKSGPITGAPGETWDNVGQALVKGLRGLHGGSSLAQ